ncbi:MAG: DM13 domain-containing protein [Saprospiraceae bacterium]|nr:DM13 domain-containing protein [Saprospiraceae bacterium]
MKKNALMFLMTGLMMVMISCTKEEVTVDSSKPTGDFSVTKSGSIVEQNSTGSKGSVQLGKDGSNNYFVKLGQDFTTVLATGTVTVYLSTSNTFKADPGNGNPDLKLIGIVQKNGEQYLKLSSAPESKFTHLILWCGSASIPFGYAAMQ